MAIRAALGADIWFARMSKTHRVHLLNNSISYFREAVSYVQQDAAVVAQSRKASAEGMPLHASALSVRTWSDL